VQHVVIVLVLVLVVDDGVAVVVVLVGTDVVVVSHGSGGNSPDKHASVEESLPQPRPSRQIIDGSQWHSGSGPVQFWCRT
jgi:hypothetical protein